MADDEFEKDTEIDSADDLFADIEPTPSGTSMDEDEVSVGEPAEENDAPKSSGRSEPTLLSYYVIPAIGALLILSLGWTFAFIARRGLSPPPQVVAKAVKPKADGLIKQSPRKERSSILGRPKRERPQARNVTVRIEHPFFIPLEGGTAKVKNGEKTQSTVFLNLSLNLLVSNKEAATEFKAKRVQIRDEIFSHYNRLSPKDLETAENRERIRRELIEKIDKKIIRGKVRGILFQEFFTR